MKCNSEYNTFYALNSMLEYGISIDKYYADKTYETLENYISTMEMIKEQNKED